MDEETEAPSALRSSECFRWLVLEYRGQRPGPSLTPLFPHASSLSLFAPLQNGTGLPPLCAVMTDVCDPGRGTQPLGVHVSYREPLARWAVWVPSDRCPPPPPWTRGCREVREGHGSLHALRRSFSPAAWPKPGSAESWPAGRPQPVTQPAPLRVRSLPPRWREGRGCFLGDADATGNWAYGGVCSLAGGSSWVGRAVFEEQVRNRMGGPFLWGPREGLGTPGQPQAQWAMTPLRAW